MYFRGHWDENVFVKKRTLSFVMGFFRCLPSGGGGRCWFGAAWVCRNPGAIVRSVTRGAVADSGVPRGEVFRSRGAFSRQPRRAFGRGRKMAGRRSGRRVGICSARWMSCRHARAGASGGLGSSWGAIRGIAGGSDSAPGRGLAGQACLRITALGLTC